MNNVLYYKISDYIGISFQVLSYGALYIHWLSIVIWSHFLVETWCLLYVLYLQNYCLYFIVMTHSLLCVLLF